MIWLKKELILKVHDRQLAEHGGSEGVRDDTLLESALARPQQLHAYGDPEPDLADLAASLCYGLARNHPFIDGNKRTAIVSTELFIQLNGAELLATDADLFLLTLDVAQGEISEKTLAKTLRENLRLPSDSIQEETATYRA